MSSLRVRYQTVEFDAMDIHVRTLRDRQQFDDVDGAAEALGISSALWPMFGVVWVAGRVLAEMMCSHDIAGKRVLEIGCGIGLASLVLNHRGADITATDQHPESHAFLRHNVGLNDDLAIPFERTGWADDDDALGCFDLIIGSDLLYEDSAVDLLPAFIDRHAGTPCDVVIVDPGRGLHAAFSKRMVALGYSHRQAPALDTPYLARPFPGQVLRYTR